MRSVLCEGIDQRQRDFAFPQVVSGRLAHGFILEIVENVVFDLEAQSEEFHEFCQILDVGLVGFHGISAHLHAAAEQRCGFLRDDVVVVLFVDVVLLGDVYLVDFAGRQFLAQFGNYLNDAIVACLDGTRQRVADKEVAYEHGYVVGPNAVDSGVAPPYFCFIDYVVVNQRSIVQQFDGGCSIEDVAVHFCEELGAEDNDYRADLLAFCFKVLLHHLVQQLAVAAERVVDNAVQLLQFCGNGFLYFVEIRHKTIFKPQN